MKKFIQKILNADESIVGINMRNIEYVYPNNPRKFFPLANDKVLSKEILEKEKIPVPKTYAVIYNLWEIEEKIQLISQYPSIVIKPANGRGGGGILILNRKDNNNWTTPSGEIITKRKLSYHIATVLYGVYSMAESDKAIVEFCLTPHDFLKQIFEEGIPDFRIIVLNRVPVMSMLRVPTKKSGGKANLHQGALGIGIDMKKGMLTHGFYKNKFINEHPDSGYHFSGIDIPDWEKTLQISVESSKLFPLNYLGVDIILDKNLGPLVIEVNARPGLQIQNINNLGLKSAILQQNL
ncbi:MAG: hypothetical protein PF485_14180 [Bacteroidales bacterium]|jgi:alpha-L-glutamate ligase-like protein|nr:hypothetical protein [Bacteroidales bacterium]